MLTVASYPSQTLFNPNKSVVKMFVVTYNFNDMPVNHMTFLRQRIFLVPVEEGAEGKSEASARERSPAPSRPKSLCYLMHLRCDDFHMSSISLVFLFADRDRLPPLLDFRVPNLERSTCTAISACCSPVNPSKWTLESIMISNLSQRCQETPNIPPACDQPQR